MPQPNPQSNASVENFVLVPKVGGWMFVFTEFCVYASQVLMFFFVAVLLSNLLRDEKLLIAYMETKINANTMFDVAATMLAIAATLGVMAALAKAAPPSSLLERISDEVLSEAPRTVYTFGSSVTGTLLAAAWFLKIHPQSNTSPGQLLGVAAIAATAGFMYGCMFAYCFKRKSHIKSLMPPSAGTPTTSRE